MSESLKYSCTCKCISVCKNGSSISISASSSDRGSLVSHGGVGLTIYGNNMNCQWHITVPSGYVVRAWISYSNIFTSIDAVRVYDSGRVTCSSEVMLGSSTSNCDSFVSASNTMRVTFNSGNYPSWHYNQHGYYEYRSSSSWRGFRLNFGAVKSADGECR
jgi:hypothetical protein